MKDTDQVSSSHPGNSIANVRLSDSSVIDSDRQHQVSRQADRISQIYSVRMSEKSVTNPSPTKKGNDNPFEPAREVI